MEYNIKCKSCENFITNIFAIKVIDNPFDFYIELFCENCISPDYSKCCSDCDVYLNNDVMRENSCTSKYLLETSGIKKETFLFNCFLCDNSGKNLVITNHNTYDFYCDECVENKDKHTCCCGVEYYGEEINTCIKLKLYSKYFITNGIVISPTPVK